MRKTVLITGASSGLGYEFAHLYAESGYDLVIVARSIATLQALKSELSAKYTSHVWVIGLDLSDPQAAEALFKQLQSHQLHIDCLVNNAGLGDFGFFQVSDFKKQTAMLELNMVALTQITYHYLQQTPIPQSGHILNVASIAAFEPGPLMAVYYATKAYVLSFSESLAVELKQQQLAITVTALCPGPTRTNFEKQAELENSRLFSSLIVHDAKKVARYGFKKAHAGRAVVIPGFLNKTVVFLTRLAPRVVIRNAVYQIQKLKN